ncbi:MAG TPA: Nif3-like dinuclear metal center hexameric protein [Saprospiraceae bacterium]|nr:Nif3-like dinuclear metal center hexameric protein [Saprospiraceae bacterium]
MPNIQEVINHLESIAPPIYQESYDNAGLICGDASAAVTGVLTCLDSTEAIIDEAIAKSCNLVVAHHPIVFRGLKKITGRNYVERTLLKAIKNDIAIYAIHTNLDNVYRQGVNARFAERLGLNNTRILSPKANLLQLRFQIDASDLEAVRKADQSFQGAAAVVTPLVNPDQYEVRASVAAGQVSDFRRAVSAFAKNGISTLDVQDKNDQIGSGMLGQLTEPMSELDFLHFLKERMQTHCVKHTALLGKPIQKVALCGGAGGFLLPAALRAQADIFITADYKYHEFFDADEQLIIADIGHFESEQFTIPLLKELLSNKFSNFAVYETAIRTNPVSYVV